MMCETKNLLTTTSLITEKWVASKIQMEFKQQDIFGKKIKDNYGGMSDIRTRKRPDSLHNFYDRDKKVYLISHAHRLIEKAKANIEGVERGIFPLPHKPKNTK